MHGGPGDTPPTGRKWTSLPSRLPRAVVDGVLLGVCALDVWFMFQFADEEPTDTAVLVVAIIAVLGVPLRRRWPFVAFLIAVPATLMAGAQATTAITLYAVAVRSRNRPVLACCTAVVAVCLVLPWPWVAGEVFDSTTLPGLGYAVSWAGAIAFLGQLVQTRRDLSARLVEIGEAREHERELVAQTVLARERAQLAREMHDVVSHQVSLIAVQAGALQMSVPDPVVSEAATTIRLLSVSTLDELRHMVAVLRASGTSLTELAPQPTLADLRPLVANSGIVTRLDGSLPADLAPSLQRAVYRTVQEALTNARKHAPGATATVEIWHDDTHLGATITNTAPTRHALALPSDRHGLVGLRERAELLGGTVTAGPTAAGGFEVRLQLGRGKPIPRPTAAEPTSGAERG
ncbi:Histidine kinase [Actinokineospora alba]|uniref:histidine kinase n=1 Tax=Actinokineospora alba TaxID=504798 RepID=A0A1H0W4T9_9PSEU|nr:histidine kinase [Actinokineospora alba]SDI73039.1 Histidine kinase [Actinokineospora alba]SDP85485.1 Histidine kinase [Actinokineospora alba]